MVFGIKDVTADIKEEVLAKFGGSVAEEDKKEEKKHSHNLKTLITEGCKEIKRDLNYSVVFLVGGTDKIAFIALGTYNNLIL